MAETKTWARVYSALEDSFRKWGDPGFTITARYQGRQATKLYSDPDDRAVTLAFWRIVNGNHRPVTITMRVHLRPLENLEAIQKAVEHIRMAEVREIERLEVLLYRQLYPQAAQATPPPPKVASSVPDHYRVLGVLPDAPMEVVEAAWKAQIRKHHPDRGGSTAKAQSINAAMDRVRAERAS